MVHIPQTNITTFFRVQSGPFVNLFLGEQSIPLKQAIVGSADLNCKTLEPAKHIHEGKMMCAVDAYLTASKVFC